jgi:hypothetical protein
MCFSCSSEVPYNFYCFRQEWVRLSASGHRFKRRTILSEGDKEPRVETLLSGFDLERPERQLIVRFIVRFVSST